MNFCRVEIDDNDDKLRYFCPKCLINLVTQTGSLEKVKEKGFIDFNPINIACLLNKSKSPPALLLHPRSTFFRKWLKSNTCQLWVQPLEVLYLDVFVQIQSFQHLKSFLIFYNGLENQYKL